MFTSTTFSSHHFNWFEKQQYSNDLHPTLEKNKISDEHLLQIVSEAVVNDSERHEKLSQEKKQKKVNEIDNLDNTPLNEIRAIKLKHSTKLAAFCAEIFQIKKGVNLRNNFCQKRIRRCPNCTVTKSNCSYCFVCGSSEHQCLYFLTMIKKLAKVAQKRHAATVSNKASCNICCVCTKNLKILYKCTKCQSGKYCLKARQTKQYLEHKKELDREKHKLEQFTVTDSEILLMKYCNQLDRLLGEKPITEGYINDKMY